MVLPAPTRPGPRPLGLLPLLRGPPQEGGGPTRFSSSRSRDRPELSAAVAHVRPALPKNSQCLRFSLRLKLFGVQSPPTCRNENPAAPRGGRPAGVLAAERSTNSRKTPLPWSLLFAPRKGSTSSLKPSYARSSRPRAGKKAACNMICIAAPTNPAHSSFTKFGNPATTTQGTPAPRITCAGTLAKTPSWPPANPPSGNNSRKVIF